jgi:hypothetical protein
MGLPVKELRETRKKTGIYSNNIYLWGLLKHLNK